LTASHVLAMLRRSAARKAANARLNSADRLKGHVSRHSALRHNLSSSRGTMDYLKKLSVAAGAALFSSAAFAQATSDMRINGYRAVPKRHLCGRRLAEGGQDTSATCMVTYTSYLVTVSNSGITSSNTVNNITFRDRHTDRVARCACGCRSDGPLPIACGTRARHCVLLLATPQVTGAITRNQRRSLTRRRRTDYIECPIGQLKAGTSKSFYVYFLAPKAPQHS